jgi:alpha-beta hydrolase superfamily lysophospholipase
VLISDFDRLITQLHVVAGNVQQRYPSLNLIIIAHSMGGMIATSYVQKYPNEVKALVLSGPLLGPYTQISTLADLQQLPTESIDAHTLSRDPTVATSYQNDQLVWHGPFKLATLKAIKKTLGKIHHGKTFGTLPVLWIHGSADSLVLLDETAVTMEKLSGSNLTKFIIPYGRHENFNEINREEIVAKLFLFINHCLSN